VSASPWNTLPANRLPLWQRAANPADEAARAEFLALYGPLLDDWARRRGVAEQAVRDVVTAGLADLWRALPALASAAPPGWLRSCLRQSLDNAITAWVHTAGRSSSAAPEEGEAEWARAYQQVVLRQVRQQVRGEADPAGWACYEQRIVARRDAAEVGAELGLSAGAVESQAGRIEERVRALCQEWAGEEP
jgi:DNA-directed RNA polymerase specialized sigma24 family protein